MKLIWNSNFPLIFLSGLAIVFTVYAVLKYGQSANFFRWRCFWRFAVLELVHGLMLGGVYYAVFSDPDNWHYAESVEWAIGLVSIPCHLWTVIFAHKLARRVRRSGGVFRTRALQ